MKILMSILAVVFSGFLFGAFVYIVSALLFGSDGSGNYYEAVVYAIIATPIGFLGCLAFLLIKRFREQ